MCCAYSAHEYAQPSDTCIPNPCLCVKNKSRHERDTVGAEGLRGLKGCTRRNRMYSYLLIAGMFIASEVNVAPVGADAAAVMDAQVAATSASENQQPAIETEAVAQGQSDGTKPIESWADVHEAAQFSPSDSTLASPKDPTIETPPPIAVCCTGGGFCAQYEGTCPVGMDKVSCPCPSPI